MSDPTPTSQRTTRDHAMEFIHHGFRPIPNKINGEKCPDLAKWEDLADPKVDYPTDEFEKWFAPGRRIGLGVVLGRVANDTAVVDAEYKDIADDFIDAVEKCLPHLAGRFPTVITPGKDGDGSGRHFSFRHHNARTVKLALLSFDEQLKRTNELIARGRFEFKMRDGKQVLISPCALEIRGDGTQILVPGGDRHQHPSARFPDAKHPEYRYLNNLRLWDAPLLSDEDFEVIVEIGKALSMVEYKESVSNFDKDDGERRAKRVDGKLLPGDDFNARGPDWRELLAGHFDYVFTGRNEVDYYRRVGKDRGVSATLGKCVSKNGLPLFYNFSSSATPFEERRCYDKFAALTTIRFDGDFKACASHLSKERYGARGGWVGFAPVAQEPVNGETPPPEIEEEPTISFFETVEDFPLDALPNRLADYCREVAEAKDAPIDYAASLVLCVASAAIGACRKIVWKPDHVEMANLYMALVGGASSGKSPTFSELLRPLQAEAEELSRENQRLLDIWEMEKEQMTATSRTAMKPPVLQEIHVEDFTVESLIPLLAHNRRGLAIPQDELTRWLESMNQYSGKGSNTDRSFYLSAWNGKPYKKNRRTGSEKILTGDVFLTIYGGIQPSRLAAVTGGTITGDGFSDRFLFCFPEPRPLKPYDFTKTVGAAARSIWDEVYRDLRGLQYVEASDSNGNKYDKAMEVFLTDGARDVFSMWDVDHIRDVNEKLIPPHLASVWGKYRAHFPRLTLILHYLRFVEGLERDEFKVSQDTVFKVVRLVEYFKSHAKKAYSTFPESKLDQQAFDLLHWMRRQNPDRQKKGWTANQLRSCRRVTKASDGEKLLDELADRGAGIFDQSGKVFFLDKMYRS